MWSEVRRFCGGLGGTEANTHAQNRSRTLFCLTIRQTRRYTVNQVNTSKTHPPLPMILVWTKWGFNATLENLRKHETQFVNLFGEPNPKPRKRMGSAHQSPW